MQEVAQNLAASEVTPKSEAAALAVVLEVLSDKGAEFVRLHHASSSEVAPHGAAVLDAVQEMRRLVRREQERLERIQETYCESCRRYEHAR